MSDMDGITTRITFGEFHKLIRCSCYINDCQGAIELNCAYYDLVTLTVIAKPFDLIKQLTETEQHWAPYYGK